MAQVCWNRWLWMTRGMWAGVAGLVAVSAQGAEIWVSPGGRDDAGAGASADPVRTLAYAAARAQAGDTIRLTGGEFQEVAQANVRSGVSIVGNGRTGAERTIVRAPASWDFTADEFGDNAGGYVLRMDGVTGSRVRGIEFRDDGTANGAILCEGSEEIRVEDVAVFDFRLFGMRFADSAFVTVTNCYIENSGYERGPEAGDALPDGGSLGNMGVHNVRDSVFDGIEIRTTQLKGYGMKMASIERCTFRNLNFHMYPFQSWRGVGPGNFDLEIHGGHVIECEFAHCRFDQTISIVGGSGAIYDRARFSAHVHHNFFDLDGSYGIEAATDALVIDHNYFKNTWSCAQHFGGSETRIMRFSFFNNVCEGVGLRVVGLKGQVEHLRMFNNSVVMAPDGWQSYFVTLGSQRDSRDWLLANNIIVAATGDVPRDLVECYGTTQAPRDVDVLHNCTLRTQMRVTIDGTPSDAAVWRHRFLNNVTGDPLFVGSGARPGEAFQLQPESPALNQGDARFGLRPALGAGREMGALEREESPWEVGVGSGSDMTYLWAPRTDLASGHFVNAVRVRFESDEPGAEIRYSLDGSEPGFDGALYQGPLILTEPARLRARTFRDGWGSATSLRLNLEKGPKGYPNIGRRGQYSASSVYQWDIYGPERAFDGDTYNWVGWSPAGGDRLPWVRVDFGSPQRVRYVELYCRAAIDDPGARRNFEIQGSNEETFGSYDVLAAQGNESIRHEGVFTNVVTSEVSYRYVRAVKTVPDEGFFVTELAIHGGELDEPDPGEATAPGGTGGGLTGGGSGTGGAHAGGGSTGGTGTVGTGTTGSDLGAGTTGGSPGGGTGGTGVGTGGGTGAVGGPTLLGWKIRVNRPKTGKRVRIEPVLRVVNGWVEETGLPFRSQGIRVEAAVITGVTGSVEGPVTVEWKPAQRVTRVGRRGKAKFVVVGVASSGNSVGSREATVWVRATDTNALGFDGAVSETGKVHIVVR